MRPGGGRRRGSLRARLFAAAAAAVLGAVALSLVTGVVLTRRSVERASLDTLGRQADLVAARERKRPGLSQKEQTLGLFLATQQEILDVLPLRQASLLLPSGGGGALRGGRPAQGYVAVHGTRYLYAARPVGSEAVIVLRSASHQAGDWVPFGVAFLFAGLVGAGLAALLAAVLARTVARPVHRVAEASRRFAAGDDPGPLPVEGSEEVAALAASFNHMREELGRAREAERSFLLSVSHELKTPLTAIRGHAEALLERVLPPAEVGDVILRESARLDRLVRDLLDLARLNRRSFSVAVEPLDLGELAREAVRRYETQARVLGVELGAEVAADAPAEGDPDRLLQLVSNLIENALRSTPPGGAVAVVAAGPGELRVEDTGPGIDAEDLPHAFERFYLYSRYRRNRSVGTGLGLAIVHELAEAMRGSVAVESERGRGTRFSVRLPVGHREAAAAR